MALTTSQITEEAKIRLSALGYEVWRNNNIAVRGRKFIGRKGVSDLIGYKKDGGTALYCEVKKPGDTLSHHQIDFLTDAHNAGCFALVAYSEGQTVKILPIENYLTL